MVSCFDPIIDCIADELEILDFGYPQNSEIDTLKMYITTESIKSELAVVSWHIRIRCKLTSAEGGFVENHDTSYRSYVLETVGREIPQERGVCRCYRDCQLDDEQGWYALACAFVMR